MVLSLGIIPGSKIEHTRYQWIDCYGRPCSPLPFKTFPTTDPDNAEESGSMRPLEDDERKVIKSNVLRLLYTSQTYGDRFISSAANCIFYLYYF